MAIIGNRNGKRPIIECTVRYAQKHWKKEGPAPERTVKALVDTGATDSIITRKVAKELGLPISGTRQNAVVGKSTTHECKTHWCDFVFRDASNGGVYERTGVQPLADILTGYDAILGWDVLSEFQIAFDRDGNFSLSW